MFRKFVIRQGVFIFLPLVKQPTKHKSIHEQPINKYYKLKLFTNFHYRSMSASVKSLISFLAHPGFSSSLYFLPKVTLKLNKYIKNIIFPIVLLFCGFSLISHHTRRATRHIQKRRSFIFLFDSRSVNEQERTNYSNQRNEWASIMYGSILGKDVSIR